MNLRAMDGSVSRVRKASTMPRSPRWARDVVEDAGLMHPYSRATSASEDHVVAAVGLASGVTVAVSWSSQSARRQTIRRRIGACLDIEDWT